MRRITVANSKYLKNACLPEQLFKVTLSAERPLPPASAHSTSARVYAGNETGPAARFFGKGVTWGQSPK